MTRLTFPKQEKHPSSLLAESVPSNEGRGNSNEASQVLELKRLLVSMKQHYEKSLQQAQIQLQAEQDQRIAAQKELEEAKIQSAESLSVYEEELQSLRDQQILLKELLKKACDDLESERNSLAPSVRASNPENIEEGQKKASFASPLTQTREKAEAEAEIARLIEKVNEEQKRSTALELRLFENEQNARLEIGNLQRLLEDQKQIGNEIETVVSSTSSHQLRRELETIKYALTQGTQEAKALESRYIETLNEKISLEHQCKQLQLQLESQSSNLISFQENLHIAEENKKRQEIALQEKEAEWIESCKKQQEIEADIERLKSQVKQKELIEDKYEHLKEEWTKLNERLEEEIDLRLQSDQHLNQLEAIAANQETQLQEFALQLQAHQIEKATLEAERDHLKNALEEGDMRLKVAQQHLAKKVKEAAILSEKQQEVQANASEFAKTIELQKTQLAQLQASVDLYQRQEKRLQDQLHDALKGTDNQIAKWEEKYFRMYDKLQEAENQNRELKKFEEKHHQIQSLLANLGNFIGQGGSYPPPRAPFPMGEEIIARPPAPSPSTEIPLEKDLSLQEMPKKDSIEEKYNLFGLSQPFDKFNPTLFS